MAAGDVTRKSARVQLLADDANTIRALGATAGGALYTIGTETAEADVDATANDTDKVITVPAGELWRIINVYVDLTPTATVGNRQILITWRDTSDNIIGHVAYDANIPANNRTRVSFGAGQGRGGTILGSNAHRGLPAGLLLPAGFDLHILDQAAVDAAADDMTVAVHHETYAV